MWKRTHRRSNHHPTFLLDSLEPRLFFSVGTASVVADSSPAGAIRSTIVVKTKPVLDGHDPYRAIPADRKGSSMGSIYNQYHH